MTSGGLTKEQAARLQRYTGRIRCDGTEIYLGRGAPACDPMCESCLLKWIENDLADDARAALQEGRDRG